ncbi:transmembrane protein 256-like isoform X1 [Bradysia coprophila]|uniref:transmembrane protein 256-like isoform X1 n=2 Tax=Bradysia coprophila TaxID=38358 RepID=UPI00187D7405|nr:transmembrane protein 256-like isoform X1 [Bradysia coprophila]
MQTITDLCDQGKQIVSPFFKGALDTLSTMTGIGGKSSAPVSTEVVKKAQEMSLAKSNIFKNLFAFDRQLIRLAGISGAIAVGLGAYGAHVVMMNDNIPEVQKNSFRTASMYHFFGTFGLVASSMTKYPAVSGTLMAIGTTIFCGACYYYGLTGDPSARKVAPFGGTALIAAWISFVL